MTYVACRLTAKNRDQLRNPTLSNRVWATFTFYIRLNGLRQNESLWQTERQTDTGPYIASRGIKTHSSTNEMSETATTSMSSRLKKLRHIFKSLKSRYYDFLLIMKVVFHRFLRILKKIVTTTLKLYNEFCNYDVKSRNNEFLINSLTRNYELIYFSEWH